MAMVCRRFDIISLDQSLWRLRNAKLLATKFSAVEPGEEFD
jgi:hypothetical protein